MTQPIYDPENRLLRIPLGDGEPYARTDLNDRCTLAYDAEGNALELAIQVTDHGDGQLRSQFIKGVEVAP